MPFRKATASKNAVSKPTAQNESVDAPQHESLSSTQQTSLPGIWTSTAGSSVTSSGCECFDVALGGGFPVGAVVLLVEDDATNHHDAFTRLFLAQGLAHSHAVALAQQHSLAQDTFACLPSPRIRAANSSLSAPHSELDSTRTPLQRDGPRSESTSPASIEIAWRYAATAEEQKSRYRPKLAKTAADTSIPMDLSTLCAPQPDAAVSFLGLDQDEPDLKAILGDIASHVATAKQRSLFARVAIAGLVPQLWDETNLSICQFVHGMRTIVASANAVALITAPSEASTAAVRRMVDAVLEINTYGGKGAGVVGFGDEWNGTIAVKKSFRPHHCIRAFKPVSDVWVFKRGRRKYAFEQATAAPDRDQSTDDSNSSTRTNAPATFTSLGGCSSVGNEARNVDF